MASSSLVENGIMGADSVVTHSFLSCGFVVVRHAKLVGAYLSEKSPWVRASHKDAIPLEDHAS